MVSQDKIKLLQYVLVHYPQLSRNEFKKIVCDELNLMTHQTFQSNLNEAVSQGLVFRTESYEGRVRKVWYHMTKDLSSAEKDRLKYFDTRMAIFDKLFNRYKDRFKRLSLGEQSEILALLYRTLDAMTFNATVFSQYYFKHSREFRTILKNLEHMRKKHLDKLFYDAGKKPRAEKTKLHQLVMIEHFSECEDSLDKINKMLSGKQSTKYDKKKLKQLDRLLAKQKTKKQKA